MSSVDGQWTVAARCRDNYPQLHMGQSGGTHLPKCNVVVLQLYTRVWSVGSYFKLHETYTVWECFEYNLVG